MNSTLIMRRPVKHLALNMAFVISISCNQRYIKRQRSSIPHLTNVTLTNSKLTTLFLLIGLVHGGLILWIHLLRMVVFFAKGWLMNSVGTNDSMMHNNLHYGILNTFAPERFYTVTHFLKTKVLQNMISVIKMFKEDAQHMPLHYY